MEDEEERHPLFFFSPPLPLWSITFFRPSLFTLFALFFPSFFLRLLASFLPFLHSFPSPLLSSFHRFRICSVSSFLSSLTLLFFIYLPPLPSFTPSSCYPLPPIFFCAFRWNPPHFLFTSSFTPTCSRFLLAFLSVPWFSSFLHFSFFLLLFHCWLLFLPTHTCTLTDSADSGVSGPSHPAADCVGGGGL